MTIIQLNLFNINKKSLPYMPDTASVLLGLLTTFHSTSTVNINWKTYHTCLTRLVSYWVFGPPFNTNFHHQPKKTYHTCLTRR